ncbi:Vegetative incompatibility protein HET-E-1 [Cladobotryum mycophilum]|uniref:Vegetative incompatibility protein HET-E-1 n=1 Tax=Cladobotryum mycophilum TaxID=491253 RepID=A0ABR0SP20_9HYPO
MRLLDANTLELVDVNDDDVPPYAILSHTWGDDEITIQQLRRLKGWSRLKDVPTKSLDKNKRAIASKVGFLKVANAAQLALSRGLSYIWVDTCCIDKTSSAELSEAINSMYLWYKQSAECYAYFSDVPPAKDEDDSVIFGRLRSSRWFTRGWTLQELIAPENVLFYANDWTLLGRKDSPVVFTKLISEITGIDEQVLNGRIDPLHLSVSARMAWAAYRNTTRLEDTAYCLMGLFQVNMPLLYGEGRRAFTRLQQEIIQRTDDQSLFAWNSFGQADEDPDALFGMLAESPAQFRDAGTLQPLPPLPVYASVPSNITNQGLRVQLYLRPVNESDDDTMEEDYYAILDCVMRVGDAYQCPVILLRRLSEDQYGRLRPKFQKFLPPPGSQFLSDAEAYRAIYVRQKPVYYTLPQFRLSPMHMESELNASDSLQYRLLETFPSDQWNSTTMTLKVDYSRKIRAMGVFRFQSVSKADEKIDVVVGLRRLNAMVWEGWCFQLSGCTSALEHVFQETNKKIETLISRNTEIMPRTLQDYLGDDSSLVSNAIVEGIQLQGRMYISVLVISTPEIETHRELIEMPLHHAIFLKNGEVVDPYDSDRVRQVTEPCFQSTLDFEPEYLFLYSAPMPVRVKPSTGEGMDTITGAFMKPLYDFVATVREQQNTAVGKSVMTLCEELAIALFDGDVRKVEQLLAKGPDLDLITADEHGMAPIHWAVAGGSADCVLLMLTNGAQSLHKTKGGLSVGHIAAICNTKVWKAFPTFMGVENGPMGLVDARTSIHFDTPLHLAAACSVESEAGSSLFREMAEWGWEHVGIGARNVYEETPLHRASAHNNNNAIQILQNRGYDLDINVVDMFGRSPLWHAAATGSCDAIKMLIAYNALVNLSDDMGRTPLHVACRGGHDEAVAILLQNSALQDVKTNTLGLTPMDFAAMFGHLGCLRQLMNVRSTLPPLATRNKALHIASSCGRFECADMLCRWGANPFVQMDYYLRMSNTTTTTFAELVEEEGNAQQVAMMEDHQHIATYFEMSETCKDHRQQRESNHVPSGLALSDRAQAIPPAPGTAPVYRVPTQSAPAPYGGYASSKPITYDYSYGQSRYQEEETYSRPYQSTQSANLPARTSSYNNYSAPTQSDRLQELTGTYDSSKIVKASSYRPATYTYEAASESRYDKQTASVPARAASYAYDSQIGTMPNQQTASVPATYHSGSVLPPPASKVNFGAYQPISVPANVTYGYDSERGPVPVDSQQTTSLPPHVMTYEHPERQTSKAKSWFGKLKSAPFPSKNVS